VPSSVQVLRFATPTQSFATAREDARARENILRQSSRQRVSECRILLTISQCGVTTEI